MGHTGKKNISRILKQQKMVEIRERIQNQIIKAVTFFNKRD